jgi:hypothetical protein
MTDRAFIRVIVTGVTISPFLIIGLALHDYEGREATHRQERLTQECEQRAVDAERASKQLKDERECKELARDADKLLASVGKLDDPKYIAAWQVGYEKCMEVRGSKP